MGAEKSHNMPSASYRTRKTSGIIQFKSEGLRIWKSENGEADVQGQEKWMSQFQQRQWILLPPSFCSIQALNRLNDAHPHQGGPSALLCLLISSGSTQTQEIVFCQLSGHLLAQSNWHKINHLDKKIRAHFRPGPLVGYCWDSTDRSLPFVPTSQSFLSFQSS